mgnify:CR=1 FL=1
MNRERKWLRNAQGKFTPSTNLSTSILEQVVEIEDAHKCNLCIECHRFCEAQGLEKAVYLGENDSKFNFIVESTGALQPVDIVKRAFGILKTKIHNFSHDLMENITGSAAQMGY